jgi:hypothetical protein
MSRISGGLVFESSQWEMAVEIMKGNWGAVFKYLNCLHKFIH